MNINRSYVFLLLGLTTVIGCTKATDTPKQEAAKVEPAPAKAKDPADKEQVKIQAAFAELSDVDRPLALAQKMCPIGNSLLGTMGKPDRIEIDGQPVFLCCSGCEKEARADPKKTLEKVAELKKAAK